MIGRLAYLRERLSTGIWPIPIGLCILCALLAISMLWLDRRYGPAGPDLEPFHMPLSSARQVLGVIAGSIISVGGVAFSVTMVALTLTSGQYGPKTLRNFLEDSASKLTLGLFLGTFVYTLIVLTSYAQDDTPRYTVFTALALSFLTLLGFVHFIHQTATDLQADQIVHRLGNQLRRALQDFVKPSDRSARTNDTLPWRRTARTQRPYLIAADAQGYVQTIDYPGLLRWCRKNDCLVQVRVRAGDFVVEGVCVFKVYGCDPQDLESAVEHLNEHMILGPIRTPIQDPEYPITQLTQLAARALSPGINDPGTAITCIDWFSLALAGLVDRDMPGCVFLDEEDRPRVLARSHDFSGIVKAVYAPLRQFAKSNIAVTVSLIDSLCRLGELTRRADRLRILALHGELIWDEVRGQAFSDYDLQDIRKRLMKLSSRTGRSFHTQA